MSASKKAVYTAKVALPMAGKVLNQAITANGMVYCSGQVAMDSSGKIIEGDVKAHTKQILDNLSAVLEAAGTSMENVVKCNIYIADVKDFAAVNEVYAKYFGDVKPARTYAMCAIVTQMDADDQQAVFKRHHLCPFPSRLNALQSYRQSHLNQVCITKQLTG
ncbi:hypothetical protein LTR78_008168 [Recurvomyces mirabilis]|uniref:Uncharacterized protein n=1 Tax=Recurvomyces mirabilis TaxID=574656 RepID=A0AAE0TUZ5_9PEZI|nr:hypothetical protein LTR78_008168 [Recurvomyces mirabilis]KAK5150633.1 hypothetical protein LTS14_009916 [Recurvomyces mirabilis]